MGKKDKTTKVINKGGASGLIGFLSFIGAAVYFVNQSFGFWGWIVAVLKGAVWPAILMYNVLLTLHVH